MRRERADDVGQSCEVQSKLASSATQHSEECCKMGDASKLIKRGHTPSITRSVLIWLLFFF